MLMQTLQLTKRNHKTYRMASRLAVIKCYETVMTTNSHHVGRDYQCHNEVQIKRTYYTRTTERTLLASTIFFHWKMANNTEGCKKITAINAQNQGSSVEKLVKSQHSILTVTDCASEVTIWLHCKYIL